MKRRGVCVYVLREKWRGAGRVTVLKQLKGRGGGGERLQREELEPNVKKFQGLIWFSMGETFLTIRTARMDCVASNGDELPILGGVQTQAG